MLFSICIPTRNRPQLLERALKSVLGSGLADDVEVIVSDNSDDDTSGVLCERLGSLSDQRLIYHRNIPAVGMVANHNRALSLASGRWVQVLHDDDFLLDGAVDVLRRVLARTDASSRALLFGVQLVDIDGAPIARQTFGREQVLGPREALRRLLGNSSFVRFPGVVIRREVYESICYFDEHFRGPVDFHTWTRVFSRYGVRCMPQKTAAYTIHADALTSSTFTPETLALIFEVFDIAATSGVLDPEDVRRCQRDYVHQFILAGAYRSLREGDRARAGGVMKMLELPEVQRLGISRKWLPVRIGLMLCAIGAR